MVRPSFPRATYWLPIAVISFVALLLALGGVSGQSSAQPQSPPGIPRTPDDKPDFTGIFEWPKAVDGEACRCTATIFDRKYFAPLKPGGEPFIKARTGNPRLDEPRDYCMPAGFPAGMLSAYPVRFSQTKDYIVIVHEFQSMTRVVPLDGRPHRENLEPTYNGDPVGHWEGDTLVIESKNFRRWQLDDHFYMNPNEYRMHSDALRTVERIRWKDKETLFYELTIDDPKIFTRSWAQEFAMKARPDWDKMGILEYVCQDNNRCPGGQCPE
jgi:hypothetical protein